MKTQRFDEAEALARRALAITESSWPPDHPDIAGDLSHLAQVLKATGRFNEAEPLMRRSLRIYQARFGDDHPNVALELNNVGSLLQATNRLAEAESFLRKAAVTILRSNIDSASLHPQTHLLLRNYAAVLHEWKGQDAVLAALLSLGTEAVMPEAQFQEILAQAFGETGS